MRTGVLAALSREFLFAQRREIAARLRIISHARNQLSLRADEKAAAILRGFDIAVGKKMSFNKLTEKFKPPLEAMGVWDETSEAMWKLINQLAEGLKEMVQEEAKQDPIWESWLSQVKGVNYLLAGEVIGGFEGALEPDETLGTHFRTVSQMWAFSGLNVENGKAPRLTPGKKASFNGQLRSILVTRLGRSLIFATGGYYDFYSRYKKGLVSRCQRQGIEIRPTSKLPKKNGKRYEPEGVIAKGHLDNMARRKMAKLFVSHLWEVVRAVEGLPSGRAYVFDVLGHPKQHYIPPIRDKVT